MDFHFQSTVHDISDDVIAPFRNHRQQIGFKVGWLHAELFLHELPHGGEVVSLIVDYEVVGAMLAVFEESADFLDYGLGTSAI